MVAKKKPPVRRTKKEVNYVILLATPRGKKVPEWFPDEGVITARFEYSGDIIDCDGWTAGIDFSLSIPEEYTRALIEAWREEYGKVYDLRLLTIAHVLPNDPYPYPRSLNRRGK